MKVISSIFALQNKSKSSAKHKFDTDGVKGIIGIPDNWPLNSDDINIHNNPFRPNIKRYRDKGSPYLSPFDAVKFSQTITFIMIEKETDETQFWIRSHHDSENPMALWPLYKHCISNFISFYHKLWAYQFWWHTSVSYSLKTTFFPAFMSKENVITNMPIRDECILIAWDALRQHTFQSICQNLDMNL